MRGSAVFRTGVAPGGALAGPWVQNSLWTAARAVPSLDLRFADNKSLVDATTGASLVTFTRASSATFVDSSGVLRSAVTNLVLRSEEFDNASWNKTGLQAFGSGSVANAIAAPNGSVTADFLVEDTSTGEHFADQGFTVVSGTSYTFSVFIKPSANKTGVMLRYTTTVFGGITNQIQVVFATGAVTVLAGTPTGTATPLPDGWWRISITGTATANGSPSARVQFYQNNGTNATYTGDGTSGYYLWGAQLEQSATVGEYIPTTSTINSAPRFDHNPTTGESLGLLVEEARTNSIRNNTMVGAVAGTPGTIPTNWTGGGTTSGITREIVGTGIENGINYIDYRIAGTTTGALFFLVSPEGSTSVAATNGQTWTFSSYARLIAGSLAGFTSINFYIAFNSSIGAGLQFVTGGITPTSAALNTQRFTRTGTASNALIAFVQPAIQFEAPTGTSIDITLRIGLPQLEQGAFATSPILTSSATVTRAADVASITGANFSSWYNQTEGTVFADFRLNGIAAQSKVVNADAGAGFANSVDIYCISGIPRFDVWESSTAQAQLSPLPSSSIGVNTDSKTTGAYKLNDFAATRTGGTLVTDTSGIIPNTSRLVIGNQGASNFLNGTIKRLTFWPTRLGSEVLPRITQP